LKFISKEKAILQTPNITTDQSSRLDVQAQVGVTKHIGSHQAIQTDLL
jgi:hypothetical protein